MKFNLQNNAGTNINLDTDVGTNRLNPIHFNAGGNYFGGVLLWINTYDSNRKIAVAGSSTSLDCRRRIKGLYYNDQRGERLRPLDEETKESFFSGSALTISGGLYTTCSGAESLGDPWGWGIYGYIGHEYN
ncbi:MAG: hypothetical protein LBD11_07205 [Candidatus Peribacteria bacterium]|nr:hypothetical protein [Candidatus Peribacteria bacterium]